MKEQQQNDGATTTARRNEVNLPQRPATAPTQAAGETGCLPYEAPTVQVIEVQTERGYAGSIDPWEPAGW